ncbi:S41 family peptidase [uncultured Tateyamaria sp.]|uniref:S41 family peptidase n=1 Tax=uncultured Tateyamaria sp. TaxID=455651 RepID=UPI002619CF7A|nr:S41 family peptidase [uncultured Tateyamaria sp.]
MGFAQDIEVIEAVMRGGDPAFVRVPNDVLDHALEALRMAASGGRDRFLLAAIEAVALGRNGHSRVIPNAAVSVIPKRIVIRDGHPVLVEQGRATRILSVDGMPCARIMADWAPMLAGNAARQRVLSGLMLGWPAALRRAGVGGGDDIRYRLVTGAERVFSRSAIVPALPLYPTGESGMLVPGQDDHGLPNGALLELREGLWWWRIADLMTLDASEVVKGVAEMSGSESTNVVIDLRGNPGGSFLKALSLIDWLRREWGGTRCAVLVDEYTFSAAIVTATLLAHHLGDRARLFGAPMGDDLAFFAEGGTTPLTDSGAHLRHSSAWHNWQTGRADHTTPPEIAAHLIGAGEVRVTPVVRAAQVGAAHAFARGD